MRVAVVGGGVFGCTAAIMLDRAGFDVLLLEAKDSILRCASGVNQFRLHEGYHYPRSPETIKECQDGLQSFCDLYGNAVDYTGDHFYAIARDSENLTSAMDYLSVLQAAGLRYELATPDFANYDEIELVIQADEGWINIHKMRSLIWEMLLNSGVQIHLQTEADPCLLDEFEHVVVACYANQNKVLELLGCEPKTYQYEVVEKVVIKAPDKFRGRGLVVMDGPFCSFDPYLGTPYHLLGHVKEAILISDVGENVEFHGPPVPINEGVQEGIQAGAIKAGMERFIPELKDAEIIGSMFTVRAVLPNKDDTDERPTVVTPDTDNITSIFSGKIGTCVSAATEVVSRLKAL